MRTYNNSAKTSSVFNQASATRVKSTFLVRPMYEGKTYPCFQSGFNATREESIRVRRMEDMRLGIEDCTPAEFEDYMGKQPVFYLQERFADEVFPGYEWNGFLLFSIRGKEDARKIALAHKDELHIILSFDDPDADIYYILVDTETGGGTHEEFLKWQEDVRDMCIKPYFRKPKGYNFDRYCRALTPEHYDIVELDVLFGKSEEEASSKVNEPMTVGQILKSFFGHLFKTA